MSPTDVKVLVPGNHLMGGLLGQRDELLRIIEAAFADAEIHVRGNEISIAGAEAERVGKLFEELVVLLELGQTLDQVNVGRTIEMVKADERPTEVLTTEVLRAAKGRTVRPKTSGQKRYVDAIAENVITFGIGPAGTGKSWLAVAMAVQALQAKQVERIILTRPAVEAGERLGFLPGDLMAKVDPYLRPLYDALYDMVEAEGAQRLLDRGTVEVAPLAFMRGRAQPVDRQVLTPTGWQAIGTLQVGDLVTGSDGRPTPVLGVFPQGRRPVFELRAQDGAATRCCAEHLWTVRTPDDRRRGKAGRTLRTDEMVGHLRRGHEHRFELPVVSSPVELEPQDVPLDPYARGLLLGDRGITLRRTPSFSTADPELADALEAALPGIELERKSKVDSVLQKVDGRHGGVLVANPVTAALRELGLAETRSATRFVPGQYRRNAPEVRLAVLQGLLDAGGGPVSHAGCSRGVQYATCSRRLRDDVVYLVRSLGGVAYSRTPIANGRAPGTARGREARHRSDVFVLDIRLPEGIAPFRLRRKAALYDERGGGRPRRFVESIEPVGEAETVCIQVGAQDSLYVTDDFLVTHNTLNDSFIILDEAQNTTPEQMKMFLTRLGFNSRMVVTGDVTQVDLPRDQRSGLVVVGDILEDVEGIDFVRFTGDDVVRHRLVQRIVEAYGEHAERSATELRPAAGRRA